MYWEMMYDNFYIEVVFVYICRFKIRIPWMFILSIVYILNVKITEKVKYVILKISTHEIFSDDCKYFVFDVIIIVKCLYNLCDRASSQLLTPINHNNSAPLVPVWEVHNYIVHCLFITAYIFNFIDIVKFTSSTFLLRNLCQFVVLMHQVLAN